MWEVYKSPSSVGRGVLGVIEVDFVQPAHDKQDVRVTECHLHPATRFSLVRRL